METLEVMPVRVKIAAILKKAILSGEYKSGEELNLKDLSDIFGVSKTPVREALQSLAGEGLIELRMSRGAVVKSIDEKFIKDHYDMRRLLEGEAAERAAENGMEVSELLAKLYHFRDNFAQMQKEQYIELNQQIHTEIWKAADNQKLYQILSGLWNGPSTGSAVSERDHFRLSTQEHIQILLAIREKDKKKARENMETHINRSYENVKKSFKQSREIH